MRTLMCIHNYNFEHENSRLTTLILNFNSIFIATVKL